MIIDEPILKFIIRPSLHHLLFVIFKGSFMNANNVDNSELASWNNVISMIPTR